MGCYTFQTPPPIPTRPASLDLGPHIPGGGESLYVAPPLPLSECFFFFDVIASAIESPNSGILIMSLSPEVPTYTDHSVTEATNAQRQAHKDPQGLTPDLGTSAHHLGPTAMWLSLLLPLPRVYACLSYLRSSMWEFVRVVSPRAWFIRQHTSLVSGPCSRGQYVALLFCVH